ncbi:MAG: hypothetical protein L6R39_002790 [Caloplaca ligustica]|nr:MAG: hypothetical protein L6R39_002790 [Caloplaca ligustica]
MVGHEGKAKAKTGHGQVLRPSDFTVAPSPNRAMSPIASHRSTTRDTQLQLEADGSTIDDRISPFSTPPSSDDSLNANASGETSPVKVQELPSPAQDVNGSKPARSPCPPGPSKTRGTPLLRREQSPLINATSKHHFGTHERRPDLPPRPEITARYSSPQAQHALGSTSTNVLGGKNTPVASPKPMNTTLPDEQQLYRPYRSSVPPSPGLAPPQLPTRMVVSRKSTPNQPLPTDVLPSDPSSRRGLEEMTANSLSPGIRPPVSGSPDNEFPDGSASNRRPPCIITGCHVIHANYDSKVFDMCAGRACSAGQLTRVWDLASGKMLLSLALGEREVRATAIAFKPAAKIDEEGSRLWVGTSYGNVHEVDIMSHRVVSSGLSPHSGREVVRIHRYQNTMWTLDEDGTLHCWPPDDSGLPTLDSKPVTWKVPRGHSFSMVIRGLLWIAAGREIQIFRPSGNNDRGEFKLAQQPPSQRGVGEITSGAVIGGQLDKVYFSHSDGRVTVYSVVDYACLGVVNASVYKINCLTGAGTHLWAGYNTGKICVYDTKVQPWKIVKEWHAHEGPVANMMVDRTGLWMSGVLRVGSVSLDNSMKMWDGLLEEDWLGTPMATITNWR